MKFQIKVSHLIITILGIMIVFMPLKIKAQDLETEFSEFMEDIEEEYDESLKAYKEEQQYFLDSVNAGFIQMMKVFDLEFQELLKEEWQPKFLEYSQEDTSTSKAIPAETPIVRMPLINKGESSMQVPRKTSKINCFGQLRAINYSSHLNYKLPGKPVPQLIAQAWNRLSRYTVDHELAQLQQIRTELRLNDWAWCQMIRQLAEHIQEGDENGEALLSWYLLIKSGYQARLGSDGERLFLLLSFSQEVYGTKKLRIGDTWYYAMEYSGEQLWTYPSDHSDFLQPLDLRIIYPMAMGGSNAQRAFRFSFEDREYDITLNYDPELTEFYRTYPHTTLGVYLHAPCSAGLHESMQNELLPLIQQKPLQWQFSFLLKLTQEAFPYLTDQEQFGIEKPFFADEMLSYPASDCEDRAIFLNKLINQLTGEKTLLVVYSGHVVSAMEELSKITGGQSLIQGGKKWTLYDPSYRDAPPGIVLPGHTSDEPSIISYPTAGTPSAFKDLTTLQVGHIDSTSLGSFNAPDGSIFTWGQFTGPLSAGPFSLANCIDSPGYFLMKSRADGTVIWLKKLPLSQLAGAYDLPFAALLDRQGSLLYLSPEDPDNIPTSGRGVLLRNQAILLNGIYSRHILQEAGQISYEGGGDYRIVSRFMKEYECSMDAGSQSLIAFAWSVLGLLREKGLVLQKVQLSSFLEEAGLPVEHPLEEARNKEGIVYMEKAGNAGQLKHLVLDRYSSSRIYYFPDRIRMKVLDGIYYRSSYSKEFVNHIDIIKNDNAIVFDYAMHYRKALGMKADIL